VLGEFPDISDDSLILPKWIEAAQKRTIKRNGRPVLAWDIARFGEDESVGMRREGGWVRVYRAHHKADTMTTTGHIAKAHRDIHAEKGLNDFPSHVVDVVGVGAGVYDRLVELGIPVVPYNGGEAPFDKERFVNARAEDYWNLREIFETGEVDIDELAAQLGSIKWTVDSRGRIKRVEGRHAQVRDAVTGPSRHPGDGDVPSRDRWAGDRCCEPPRREHHWGPADQGVVGIKEPAITTGWASLPRRIYLRTSTLQKLYEFGGEVVGQLEESFLSPSRRDDLPVLICYEGLLDVELHDESRQ
jgi:hypothetical protein